MSADSKIRPEAVSTSRAPPLENQTRLTGPVAGEAKESSMVEDPILRQLGRIESGGVV
jgi:hypothetical protein